MVYTDPLELMALIKRLYNREVTESSVVINCALLEFNDDPYSLDTYHRITVNFNVQALEVWNNIDSDKLSQWVRAMCI